VNQAGPAPADPCSQPADPTTPVVPRRAYTVPIAGGRSLQLGDRTLVMAIINVTPDSFAEVSPSTDPTRALDIAQAAADQGADLLDLGAESTRPGASPVPPEEELRRLLPALRAIAARVRLPISVDTSRASVARAALDAGAALVNDVSGLRYDPDLGHVVAGAGAGLVLMHMRGRPADMYGNATYGDVIADVRHELEHSIRLAREAGVPREATVLDPGLGFAKRAGHTYEVLARLAELAVLGRPLLVGSSRKSFLQVALGETPPAARDWGTAATVAAAVLEGAHLVRVHAVGEMVQVVRVADELRRHARVSP
jgi:dihydropteroate synthase